MSYANFEELLGKIIVKIERTDKNILFYLSNGAIYDQYHSQHCCESVTIDDIDGDLDDLIGSRILQADESINKGTTGESSTWTFYKLATIKGYVTIKWYGESNGYYSEGVDFEKTKDEDPIREIRKAKLDNINKNRC